MKGVLDFPGEIKAGLQLSVAARLFQANSTEVSQTRFSVDVLGVILSVVSVSNGTAWAHGSAFMVAPGIAFTAAHVITEYERAGRVDDSGAIFLIGGFGDALRAWQVQSIAMPEMGDVAILCALPRFAFGNELEINHAELTARTPPAGEPCVAIGLVADHPEFEWNDGIPMEITGMVSAGKTLEFIAQRDRVMLPWPTVRCNFAAPGGISGSPVFDASGRAWGVVTSSIEFDDGWETYVSPIFGATLFTIDPQWPAGFYKAPNCFWPGNVDEAWRIGVGAEGAVLYEATDGVRYVWTKDRV